jgi:hypothetical protein
MRFNRWPHQHFRMMHHSVWDYGAHLPAELIALSLP